MTPKLIDAAEKRDSAQTGQRVMPTRPKRNAAAPIAPNAGRATRTSGAAHADEANGGRATARRTVATAEAIEREVRVAYEARRRPAPPGVDAGGGSASVWDWFRDEAAAMHEIASRLVPAGWPWGIQMELFPPGVRLVLDGPRRARKR